MPSENRVGALLTVVRSFYVWACWRGLVKESALRHLYVGVANLRGTGEVPRGARAAHPVRSTTTVGVQAARLEEVVGLYRAALNWRDRVMVLLLAFAGLRIGEAAGLHVADVHLMTDPSIVGCRHLDAGPHLHVVRRANPNGATAKSVRQRVVPLPPLVVVAYGEYRAWLTDHLALRQPSEFVMVGLRESQPSAGRPVTTGSLREQFDAMVARAGLRPSLTPHQLRHF